MAKLSEPEILERMATAKGGERHGDMLVRSWQFPSFRRALEFVNLVAERAEKHDHHPDIILSYRQVRLELSTHSDGGLTPSNDGNVIRLIVPELTEERRKQLVKVVRHIAEEGRVAIRNVRRDVMHDLRELKEGGDAGSDDERRGEAALQKVTDGHIADLDELLKHKEEDILEV